MSSTITGDAIITPIVSLVKSHTYAVVVDVEAFVDAYVSFTNNQGATAPVVATSGSVNMATLGRGWAINWISVA